MLISDWISAVFSSVLPPALRSAPGIRTGARRCRASSPCSSMPDEPPQAIHGLLSASPGRNAALAIRCRCFFQQPKIKSRRGRDPDLCGFNRSADGYVKVSRVLAAGGRDKRAMEGARPPPDQIGRASCREREGPYV